MTRYLYDGTSEGLLSAAARIIAEDAEPGSAVLSVRENSLFEEGLYTVTDPQVAEAFFFRLRRTAPEAASVLCFFLLSERMGMESALLRYLVQAFRYGDRVNGNLADTAVRDVVTVSHKVSRELHRMKGLLRFEKLRDGAYLARMEPDHNIIQPLSVHFSKWLQGRRLVYLRCQAAYGCPVAQRSAFARFHRTVYRSGAFRR